MNKWLSPKVRIREMNEQNVFMNYPAVGPMSYSIKKYSEG